jgi:hypothetical protein
VRDKKKSYKLEKCRNNASATGVQQSARGLTWEGADVHVKKVQYKIYETRIRHTRNATEAKNRHIGANEHVKC